jgi:hypothetical protein
MSARAEHGLAGTAHAQAHDARAEARRTPALFLAAMWALTAYHLGLALFMAAAPHAFYTSVGPFGAYNDHYIRDTATFSAALGVGLAISIRRPSWRIPVLTVVTVQFALHSVNHLVDIDRAHPAWTGYFDFASLLVSTCLLAWMLRGAVGASRKLPTPAQGDPR